MQQGVSPLVDQEQFIREILALYKESPALWDKNHKHYKNRAERSEATEALLFKCREFYPEADEDFVKLRIESLRSCFRKEWNKVRFSKETAETSDDVYKPTLWYYGLLLFTVGEESTEESTMHDAMRIPIWSREYSVILINLIKVHPCLHNSNPSSASLSQRNVAYKQITRELNDATGKSFSVDDIKRKIQLFKGQYRYELKKIKLSKENGTPHKCTLWCFDLLSFLKTKTAKDMSEKDLCRNKEFIKNAKRSCGLKNYISYTEQLEETEDVKEENNSSEYGTEDIADNEQDEKQMDYDDIFDTIGKNVAYKLRDMSDDQRKYAEKIIRDITYHGLMENLSETSRLSLDGT